MGSGLSFNDSSKAFGGETLALAVVGGNVGDGSRSVWGQRAKRAELQGKRDDSSVRQPYRTAFCALKHKRSNYKPVVYIDSGLYFDVFSGVIGGEGMALEVRGGKVGGGSSSVEGRG